MLFRVFKVLGVASYGLRFLQGERVRPRKPWSRVPDTRRSRSSSLRLAFTATLRLCSGQATTHTTTKLLVAGGFTKSFELQAVLGAAFCMSGEGSLNETVSCGRAL